MVRSMLGGLASRMAAKVRDLGGQTREGKGTSNWKTCSLAEGRDW